MLFQLTLYCLLLLEVVQKGHSKARKGTEGQWEFARNICKHYQRWHAAGGGLLADVNVSETYQMFLCLHVSPFVALWLVETIIRSETLMKETQSNLFTSVSIASCINRNTWYKHKIKVKLNKYLAGQWRGIISGQPWTTLQCLILATVLLLCQSYVSTILASVS